MTNNPLVAGGQTLPADPAQMNDVYAQYAQAYAETERRPGSSISVKNGMLMVGDDVIPGNQFAAVILDSVRLNTFYTTAYNPQVVTPPVCYAVGRNDMEMAPHPDMQKDLSWFQPQAERCNACPHNEFGSAAQGRGKACSNKRRILLLLAGTYNGQQLQPYTDIQHYETSPFLTLTVPPTSTPGWGQFVRTAESSYRRPPFGVIARVYLYAHPKHGKEAVGFEIIAPVPDEWGATVFKRNQEAQKEIMEGYDPPQQQQAQGGGYAQQGGPGGFYGAQQQVQPPAQQWQGGPGAPVFGQGSGGMR